MDDGVHFDIETRVFYSKAFKKEPTMWYLETVMPGLPMTFYAHWLESEQRLKWDPQISAHRKVRLYKDEQTILEVINNLTNPAVGGLISPRQFTVISQLWKLGNHGFEDAMQSVNHPAFPPKKGHVDAYNALSAERVTVIDEKELKEKYAIPELKVKRNVAVNQDDDAKNDGYEQEGEVLKWCKIQTVLQTDIKGWLPTAVVETGISGGWSASFDQCREYMLKKVFGLNVKIETVSK